MTDHGITDNPDTCICRRVPWVTVDMLGGYYHTREDGTQLVRCPDREHCHGGTPLDRGYLPRHYRNIDGHCNWTMMRVRPSMPCLCGGWPWVQESVLDIVIHETLAPASPIRAVSCPGCRRLTSVERGYITMHPRRARENCVWSGIYIAARNGTPPLPAPPGVETPASIRA